MKEKISIENLPSVDSKNQKHLVRYVNFINSRPERELHQKGFHTHHIYPKSLAKKDDVQDYDGDWNLIELTPREHFIAHLILWKAYKSKMTQAFYYMSLNKQYDCRLTSKQFARLDDEKRAYCSDINKGTIFITNGSINKRMDSKICIPKGFKRGVTRSIDLNNTIWVNDGLNSKQVKPDEIPKGWVIGMAGDRQWINNGTENRYILTTEEVPAGFSKGRLSIGYWIHNDKEEKYTNEDVVPQGYEIGRLLTTTKNTKWITDGKINKMIPKEQELPKGYKEGMTTDVKGYRLITDGKNTKYLYDNETIPEGWQYGSTQNVKYKNWITNGKINKKWDLSEEKPEGFWEGKTTLGIIITNGKVAKMINKDEEIPEGWRRGRLKRTKQQIKESLTI